MAKCSVCGNIVPDQLEFCPVCGAKMSWQNPNDTAYMGSSDITYEFAQSDINSHKGMAVLSYLGVLVLIPLLANRDSKYARFHTIQGLNVFILGLLVNLIEKVGSLMLKIPFVFFHIGWSGFFDLLDLIVLIYIILGIVNAAKGRARELPIIGKIHLLRM